MRKFRGRTVTNPKGRYMIVSQVRTLIFLPCLRAVALSSNATLLSSTFVTVWIWVC